MTGKKVVQPGMPIPLLWLNRSLHQGMYEKHMLKIHEIVNSPEYHYQEIYLEENGTYKDGQHNNFSYAKAGTVIQSQ